MGGEWRAFGRAPALVICVTYEKNSIPTTVKGKVPLNSIGIDERVPYWWRVVGLALVITLMPMSALMGATIEATAELSETNPYVRQSAVYTVRIHTDQSLETANVSLPGVDGGVFTRLDEEWSARTTNGVRGATYVNELRYLFTPIKAGYIEIPPARIKVSVAQAQPQPSYGQPWSQPQYGYQNPGFPGYGQPPSPQAEPPKTAPRNYEIETQSLGLDAMGLVGAAAGLMPALELRLEGQLQSVGAPRVGEPVTVNVTITAVGATGDALPEIVELLQSGDKNNDFKIYADRPRVDTRFDERLQLVVGQRTETVTLVPRRTGAMQLPIVEIPYWNTITGSEDVARLATRPLRVQAGAPGTATVDPVPPRSGVGGDRPLPLHTDSEDFRGFWLPVGGALLAAFIIGWRMGVGHRRQRRTENEQNISASAHDTGGFQAVRPAVARVRRLASAALPGNWRERLSEGFSALLRGINRIMPRRLRVWTCMRCVQRAEEPSGICRILRRFASDCLGLPDNTPIKSIGQALANGRPTAETSSYLNLFAQLDDAVYGKSDKAFDMERWKSDFQAQFGRLLRGGHGSGKGSKRATLPELNPR